jgi:extracellular factor (EF) 3-hydroxypalmitic acid methyl ester biosynthesis protein
MEYWVDWVLFHRTEKEFLSMLDGISPAKTSVLYDDTGSQMFLHIKKPD